ncbi:hypothetical protein AB0892_03825 [Streptomyces sp. NPDC005409]|uniref:hypothetical protein n=1 Tax=Streptomyces sp. NPDC005409 TaxID=3155342 RepID=UPI0034513D81
MSNQNRQPRTTVRAEAPGEPAEGREEQVPAHPGPDPVHPEASRPVPGKSPEELRKRQEQQMHHGDEH